MLLRNSGIRDIETVLGVGRKCVLNTLLAESGRGELSPRLKHYKSVQIDEFGSYVHQRKKKKRGFIDAYCRETKEVMGYVIGNRSIKTVKKRYKLLENMTIDEYCTDDWKAFKNVLKEENHQIGKHFTKDIEGVNTSLRARNRRFVRQTTCFSKKDEYHEAAIKIMFQQRNYTYHTF